MGPGEVLESSWSFEYEVAIPVVFIDEVIVALIEVECPVVSFLDMPWLATKSQLNVIILP